MSFPLFWFPISWQSVLTRLSSSDAETRGVYLCIINMDETCRYIHESKKPQLSYNYPLQNHVLNVEVIDKSVKIPLNCCAIFFYSPPYLKSRRLLILVCCSVVCSFGGLKSRCCVRVGWQWFFVQLLAELRVFYVLDFPKGGGLAMCCCGAG